MSFYLASSEIIAAAKGSSLSFCQRDQFLNVINLLCVNQFLAGLLCRPPASCSCLSRVDFVPFSLGIIPISTHFKQSAK